MSTEHLKRSEPWWRKTLKFVHEHNAWALGLLGFIVLVFQTQIASEQTAISKTLGHLSLSQHLATLESAHLSQGIAAARFQVIAELCERPEMDVHEINSSIYVRTKGDNPWGSDSTLARDCSSPIPDQLRLMTHEEDWSTRTTTAARAAALCALVRSALDACTQARDATAKEISAARQQRDALSN